MKSKKKCINVLLAFTIIFCLLGTQNVFANELDSSTKVESKSINGEYTTIIEAFDWGPAITKLVLIQKQAIKAEDVKIDNYSVFVERKFEDGSSISPEDKGERKVTAAYLSDESGNKINDTQGQFVTIEMEFGPENLLSSPFYFDIEMFRNFWVDCIYEIKDKSSNEIWNVNRSTINLIADDFEKSSFDYNSSGFGNQTLHYATYAPAKDDKTNPLVIWLHGGGEGGTDPNIALLGNEVVNFATEEYQSYFDGAYVLAPQTPTFWLDQGNGEFTTDGSSMYTEILMKLIENYVSNQPDIDTNRIYIGGCSNGGFMTMRMIIDNPEYFAAAYPICEAFSDQWITDEDIQNIKNIPIWFTHAKGDELVDVNEHSLATYKRLIEAGAKDVHLSLFEAVHDTSGLYFQPDNVTPYAYNPHFSWIYTLNNECKLDYDGNPVKIDNKEVTLLEWVASHSKGNIDVKEKSDSVNISLVILIIVIVVVAGSWFFIKQNRRRGK